MPTRQIPIAALDNERHVLAHRIQLLTKLGLRQDGLDAEQVVDPVQQLRVQRAIAVGAKHQPRAHLPWRVFHRALEQLRIDIGGRLLDVVERALADYGNAIKWMHSAEPTTSLHFVVVVV